MECSRTLFGFAGEQVEIRGMIEIKMVFGVGANARSIPVAHIVVNAWASYNIIIEHPVLNKLRAVVSTLHLCMKYPVGRDVGCFRMELNRHVEKQHGLFVPLYIHCYWNQAGGLEEKTIGGGEVEGDEGGNRQTINGQLHQRATIPPTWLANVVMVRKSSDKWWMCTNNTDLNKAYPKNPYLLPNID
ncbi:hypothetical protein CR513_52404, partial [Mucuna pruriens]